MIELVEITETLSPTPAVLAAIELPAKFRRIPLFFVKAEELARNDEEREYLRDYILLFTVEEVVGKNRGVIAWWDAYLVNAGNATALRYATDLHAGVYGGSGLERVPRVKFSGESAKAWREATIRARNMAYILRNDPLFIVPLASVNGDDVLQNAGNAVDRGVWRNVCEHLAKRDTRLYSLLLIARAVGLRNAETVSAVLMQSRSEGEDGWDCLEGVRVLREVSRTACLIVKSVEWKKAEYCGYGSHIVLANYGGSRGSVGDWMRIFAEKNLRKRGGKIVRAASNDLPKWWCGYYGEIYVNERDVENYMITLSFAEALARYVGALGMSCSNFPDERKKTYAMVHGYVSIVKPVLDNALKLFCDFRALFDAKEKAIAVIEEWRKKVVYEGEFPEKPSPLLNPSLYLDPADVEYIHVDNNRVVPYLPDFESFFAGLSELENEVEKRVARMARARVKSLRCLCYRENIPAFARLVALAIADVAFVLGNLFTYLEIDVANAFKVEE